ncbi:hypothetical protein HAX54_007619 [Datura stramonium]|uniref:MACPF domain-containing protein n=1 Tax=Datura stramonium TaxID=4076 RepID=A0ABS8TDE3_DATST|nr:hypothetical protein [Datura stramonium]
MDIKANMAKIYDITLICSFFGEGEHSMMMVEYFNRKANLSGHGPLGSFSVAFSYTGSKHIDSASTKTLCMDGFFIPLSKLQLMTSPLVLRKMLQRAVPTSWDPPALARTLEIRGSPGPKPYKFRLVIHHFFNNQGYILNPLVQFIYSRNGKGFITFPFSIFPAGFFCNFLDPDVTVIFRRRGGDDLNKSTQWAKTVRSSPDVIEMSFVPIVLLLEGVKGRDHLARAISLYLEYKPQIEELDIWSFRSQELYVSQEQVSVGRKPVTGMRLYLEGSKGNRLCIHLQHLVSLPRILQPYWESHIAIGAQSGAGSGKNKIVDVTGSQLGVWDFGSRNVLHMRLLYSRLPGCLLEDWPGTIPRNDKDEQGTSGPPGHCYQAGGKLSGVEKGKIVLRLKYFFAKLLVNRV